MATPLEILLTGDVLSAAVTVYTDVMGFWFYVLGFFALEIMIYYKSKSIPIMSILGLTVGSAMAGTSLFPPEAAAVVYIILALSTAGVLYTVFGPKS